MTGILNQVIRIMMEQYGSDLTVYESGFLQKAIADRQDETGCLAADPYIRRLAHDPAEAGALLAAFRITFTDFFRDTIVFSQLERHILPELARRRGSAGREIRVWSAGCATGQEAYSLAMLLSEQRLINGNGLRFRIFATDIDPEALATAEAGVYGRQSLQNLRQRHIERYFADNGDDCIVVEPLRQAISFSVYDLLDESSAHPADCIFGDFDLIFCSNLLFYYKPAQQGFIIRKLQNALADDGYLVTGETESLAVERATHLQPHALTVPIFSRPATAVAGRRRSS